MSAAPKSPRRRAREFALQGVYQWLLNQSALTSIESQMAEVGGFDKCDRDLFLGLLRGTIGNAADQTLQPQLIATPLRQTGHRHMAATAQRAVHRPLGFHAGARACIVQPRHFVC